MTDVSLLSGDMLEVIPRLVTEGVICDSCVCDPPYHLGPTQKRFGAANSAPAQYGRDGAMSRLSSGFMGAKWDGGDIAFRPETWATVATVLRPGAFLLAFGGTRTYHRLVCAIEDAGFIVQDQIAWVFGSGFPKRKDMLKPAFEPICLAYKPGGKRSLQVDECRVETDWSSDPTRRGWQGRQLSHDGGAVRFVDHNKKASQPNELGRWPANLCHDGSDEALEAFPDAPGAFAAVKGNEPSASARFIYGGLAGRHSPREPVGDNGSAARFFYCAKADAQDRWGSKHPTVKPVELMKWLVPLVTPSGGLVLDCFAGSGTTGLAALATGRDAILIEREAEYIADIEARLAYYRGEGSHSLAVKNRQRRPADPEDDLFSQAAKDAAD